MSDMAIDARSLLGNNIAPTTEKKTKTKFFKEALVTCDTCPLKSKVKSPRHDPVGYGRSGIFVVGDLVGVDDYKGVQKYRDILYKALRQPK